MQIRESSLENLKQISGKYSGIIPDISYYFQGNNIESGLNLISTPIPHYEKQSTNINAEVSYHLSGYDTSIQGALPRLCGEAVERYAGIISHKYKSNNIFKSTYSNLEIDAAPLEYFNFYSNVQLSTLSSIISGFRNRPLKCDDKISWVKTNSLFNEDRLMAVPAQSFFLGFNENTKRNMVGISTGTAAYTNVKQALLNAINEYLQIDAFMFSWYSGCNYDSYKINDLPKTVSEKILDTLGGLNDCYDCIFVNISKYAKIKINIWGCFLISKVNNLAPAIVFGLQGDLSEENAIIRSFHESLANLIMCQNKYILSKNRNFNIDITKIVDMDSNVEYFADPKNFEKNKQYILSRLNFKNNYEINGNPKIKDLSQLIYELQRKCPYSSYLDITPPFIKGYRVIRIYIPELLPVSFPSFPQIEHPRFKNRELSNEYLIHPLP